MLVLLSIPACEAPASRALNQLGLSSSRVDTGDTSSTATVWEPGDPIPGWDDYDCGTPEDASYLEVSLSTVTYTGVVIAGPGDGTVDYRGGRVSIADCVTSSDPSCASYGIGWGSHGFTYLMVEYTDVSGDSIEPRGQGRFLHDGDRDQRNYGETELQYWESFGRVEYEYDSARTAFCISRMRPDEMSGVMEVYPRLWDGGTPDYLRFYHDVRVRIPFTVSFVEHSAVLMDEPTDAFTEPAGADRVGYGYDGLTYDEAWPWDSITDPTIRDAVYERYTPWNTP